jgi:exonuclease III
LDLGFRGPKFTWNNGQKGDAFIKERLDRVVANAGWCTIFPNADIKVKEAMSLDHCPLFVTLNDEKRGRMWHPTLPGYVR